MSPGLVKMWFALSAMGLMFIAVFAIYLSRFKLKGIFKIITGVVAYLSMLIAGLIILFVVFSGPVSE